MIHDAFPTVSLHNVVETRSPEWTDDGHALHRVPEAVRTRLNVGARGRYREPAGCELRFVPTDDASPVEVTVSAGDSTVVHPFWGPFQPEEPRPIGPEPTTHSFSMPPRVAALRDDVPTGAFDPRVCRLRFDAWAPVAVHDVTGPCRPPAAFRAGEVDGDGNEDGDGSDDDGELPARRYLAYGTSITEGASASATHLTYVSRLARSLGVDALNLGTAGTAYCEPAMAEYVAERSDWDLATLAVSVNMANRGFTVAQFRDRVEGLFDAVAGADTDRPVFAVSLFPYHADVVAGDDADRAAAFRDVVREAVADSPHENLHLVPGESVVDATGLTTDLLHPGDAGMAAIADGLSSAIQEVLP